MEDDANQNVRDTNQQHKGDGTAKAAGKKAAKAGVKAAKKVGKSAQAAGKVASNTSSIVAFFSTPVGWVVLAIIVIIFIIILIIGLVGFVATMPGLFVEKLIEFFDKLGDWLYSNPTKNPPITVDDGQRLELAQYVESMGYNVVGYGFTEFATRDSDGKLKEVWSYTQSGEKVYNNDCLYAYILANERTYSLTSSARETIWNDVVDFGKKIFVPGYFWKETYAKFFTNYPKSTEGMIDIDWKGNNKKPGNAFDTIEINKENKTLAINRWNPDWDDWFKVDTWEWDLDGWTGRYGKPVELSLAFHLSTMAPDFSYNLCMDERLQTQVQLALQGITYDADYKFVTSNGTTLTEEMIDEEYEAIMREAQIAQDVKKAEEDTINLSEKGWGIDIFPVDVLKDATVVSIIKSNHSGSVWRQKVIDKDGKHLQIYDSNGDLKFNDYFFFAMNGNVFGNPLNNTHIEQSMNSVVEYKDGAYDFTIECMSLDDAIRLLKSGDVWYDKNRIDNDEVALLRKSFIAMRETCSRTIDAEIEQIEKSGSQHGTYKIDDITVYTGDQKNGNGYCYYASEFDQFVTNFGDSFFENHTPDSEELVEMGNRLQEIQDAIKADYEVVWQDYMIVAAAKSQNLKDWGIDFATLGDLHDVFDALQDEVETYQPYITYVKNHWYRDIYFDPGTYEGDSQNIKSMDFDDVYEKTSVTSIEHDFNPSGAATANETNKKVNQINSSGAGQIKVELTPSSGNMITQVGQPGITKSEKHHWLVKNWLQYGYFFIYDGSESTATSIRWAKKYLRDNGLYYINLDWYDEDSKKTIKAYEVDPLLGINGEKELSSGDIAAIDNKAKEINQKLKEYFKAENASGFRFPGVELKKIEFEKNASLAAFSILENVHSLDSELVYRDLKEFMIELGYFKRSDFEKIESKVLSWVIPDYKPTEWPKIKYEKKDAEYGTFILSKRDAAKALAENPSTASSSQSTTTSSTASSLRSSVTGYLFIGDSITVGFSGASNPVSGNVSNSNLGNCYYEAFVGAKISDWITKYDSSIKPYTSQSINGIVVMLGANEISNADGMKILLGKLKADFPGKPITVLGTLHFAKGWNSWAAGNDYTVQNQKIDKFNADIKEYCYKNDIDHIDVSSGLYENNGELKYTTDGVHPSGEGVTKLVENIKNGIETGKSAARDEFGFEEGLNVVSPGKGEIVEITDNSVTIKFTSDNKVKDMTLLMEGFDVDTYSLNVGDNIESGAVLGVTTKESIMLLLKDKTMAVINNIEDYITSPKTPKVKATSTGSVDKAVAFIWRWEGVSDADPNDGDYYTVCYPPGDVPTIGHGVTGYTVETWKQVVPNWSDYIDASGTFVAQKIPKDVVDAVSTAVIQNQLDALDETLASYGITNWGIDQKAAYISLQYNGFAQKRAQLLAAYGSGNDAGGRQIWLDCYNRDQYALGHKRRRATELEIFYEGNYDADPDEAYHKYYD